MAILGRRLRRLVGRETEMDRARSEWAFLRRELRHIGGVRPATDRGGWLDYFDVLAAAAEGIPADPPTRLRIIALEVFENTVYHDGRPHVDCDCAPYRERAAERNAHVLAGRKPPLMRFAR